MTDKQLRRQLREAIIKQDPERVKMLLAANQKLRENNTNRSPKHKRKLIPQILTALIKSTSKN